MADSLFVTHFGGLQEIYSSSNVVPQQQRWLNLQREFFATYRHAHQAIARAPGRINLIGEHIDYSLFGVVPIAVELDTLIAVSASPTPHTRNCLRITVNNTNPRWATTSFVTRYHSEGWTSDEDETTSDWMFYVRAALECVLDEFFANGGVKCESINLLVDGSIPPGSGMSSSAALVVASIIAFLQAFGILAKVNLSHLLDLARTSEARIGVNTGGMDQAASILSNKGHGLYVSFWPRLGSKMVAMPSVPRQLGKPASLGGTGKDPLVLVIANSLTTHSLAADAKRHYNLRVVETLIAAKLLSHALGLTLPKDNIKPPTLREITGRFFGESTTSMDDEELKEALQGLLVEVDRVLGSDQAKRVGGFTVSDMIQISGMSTQAFSRVYLEAIEIEADTFHLYNRAKHVLTEALRVLHFLKVCRVSEPSLDDIELLGSLMDDSHESCRSLFDCSCDELNELFEVCKNSGAIGARMSGAGWGGCVVSLVPESQAQEYISNIVNPLTGYSGYSTLGKAALGNSVFRTSPGSGAGIFVGTEDCNFQHLLLA